MDSDFVVGIDKSIDAAKGITGREYPSYLHNTVVTEKLDELAEAIGEGSGGASSLADLEDVDISGTIQGGQVIKYNAVEDKWAPGDDSGNVQSDWNENDSSSGAYILNKPSIPNAPIELTQAEYDALTPAEKMSDTPYLITDANGDGSQFQPVIYSTTEREIGVWTNGKPLYEKTIITNSSVTNADVDVDISNLNVDIIIYIGGEYSRKVDNLELYYPWGGNEYNTKDQIVFGSYCRFYKTNNSITYKIIHKDNSTTDYQRFTIQYTKTTDAPGSGTWTPQGVPAVHYSTDEQVVGTWIDGTPVYEKSFSLTSPAANASANIIEVTELNIDKLISLEGNINSSSNSIATGNSEWRLWLRRNWESSLKDYIACFITFAGYASQPCVITIRYTKSST